MISLELTLLFSQTAEENRRRSGCAEQPQRHAEGAASPGQNGR